MVEELNQGDYFIKEVDTHKYYSRAWQKAHLTWLNQAKALPESMTPVHAVAIVVFTLNLNVSSDLAKAMARAAGSPGQYSQSFHFKYLHYYLYKERQSVLQGVPRDEGCEHWSQRRFHHSIRPVPLCLPAKGRDTGVWKPNPVYHFHLSGCLCARLLSQEGSLDPPL